MATSINSVTIVGNLTRDAEFKAISSGTYVINFSVALNRVRRDQNGNWIDEVSYINVTSFSKSTSLEKYLLKGKMVGVQGELRQDRWEKDGKTNSKVYVFSNTIQLLGGTNSHSQNHSSSQDNSGSSFQGYDDNIDDDDDDDVVPF